MTEPVLVTKPIDGNSKRVIKFGVIGGVLVLAVLVLPKLFGGGGGHNADLSATPAGLPTTTTTVVTGGGGGAQTLRSFGGRDPFVPLIADASSSTAPTVPSGSSVATLPGGDISTTSGADVSGTALPNGPSTTLPPPPTHRLSLLEVYTRLDGTPGARVRVDDAVMETAVGQDFGSSYRTVSLDPTKGCGVFLFGDQRISLCERQEAQT